MPRIYRGDYSENPHPCSLTNLNRRGSRCGKERECAEDMGYKYWYVLQLLVQKVTNIDELTGAFLPTRRTMGGKYSVVLSDQGFECKTRVVTVGDLEPTWNECFSMLLDDFSGFMDVEIIDENHGEDPKTSQGHVVVGRARIRMPEDFGMVKKTTAELVKEVGFRNTVVGYIHLKLMLSRAHARDIARLP